MRGLKNKLNNLPKVILQNLPYAEFSWKSNFEGTTPTYKTATYAKKNRNAIFYLRVPTELWPFLNPELTLNIVNRTPNNFLKAENEIISMVQML